jgi:predicted DNA-binding transcriptional regulator AlpA
MQIEREYLNEKEVAQLTGRALSTLRNERHLRKGFNFVKIGRSVKYSKAEVIAFMEARKVVTEEI